MEPTKHLNTKVIGAGLALLLLAITPLAAAHGASVHNLAAGQLVCVGPPHIIAAGGVITVTATWNPATQNIGVGVCTAPVNADGTCPAPTAGSYATVSGGAATVSATINTRSCVWPSAHNPGPQAVTVTISSNP